MTRLSALAVWLRRRLGNEDLPTLYRPGHERVRALALALEPDDLPEQVAADALFLHRPFRLGPRFAGLGVLASHQGFDAQLTTADNRALAARLGWRDLRPFAPAGKVIGLLATPPQRGWSELLAALDGEFGGQEEVLAPGACCSRLALMSAMRPELLTAARDLGATVYVTGQFREGSRARARELSLGVVALGHRRSEVWGLRQLARELGQAFPGLQTRVYA